VTAVMTEPAITTANFTIWLSCRLVVFGPIYTPSLLEKFFN
jgi:hypothetical protein